MKKILIVLGILIGSYNQAKKENNTIIENSFKITQSTSNFDWLLGKWKKLNEKGDKKTFENWRKISKKEYSGIDFIMKDGDTIKKERYSLIKSNEDWNMIIKYSDSIEPIEFKGTNHSENEFTCENKQIYFPSKIKYWKNGNKLNTAISNSVMKLSFEFEKL